MPTPLAEHRQRSRIWTPASVKERQVAHVCRLCKAVFYADEPESNRRKHMESCVSENEDRIRAIVHGHNETRMERPAWADLEKEEWLEKRWADGRYEDGKPLEAPYRP